MYRRLTLLTIASMLAPWLSGAGIARAETDFSEFSLTRAAPADAFITVAARGNAERKFLNEYWGAVTDAFWESGIVTDVWDLLSEEVSEDALAEIEDVKRRFSDLCENIGWSELFEKEFLYTGRFASAGPAVPFFYEGAVLGRCRNAEVAAKNYNSIKALLQELAKLLEAKTGGPVFNLSTDEREDGLTLTRAAIAPAPFIEINLGIRRDMLMITFGTPQIITDLMANMSDAKEAGRLISTPRFKAAFKELPAAEDTVVFFDVDRMLGTFRNLANMVERQASTTTAPAAGGPPPEAAQAARVFSLLLKDLSIVDYCATVEWTEGYRTFSDTRTALLDGGRESPVFSVFRADQSIEDFAKFLPKETTSFSVSAGFDLSAVYDYVVNFIQKNVPDGDKAIEAWTAFQQNDLKMNIKEEILDLIQGASVSVSMDKDSVWMFRVTDEVKAKAQLQRLIDFGKAVGQQQGATIVPVAVGPEIEFSQVSHPMLMMSGIAPVIGVAADHLVIGTSATAVKTVLQTGRGKHANVTENAKWKKEAIAPDGAVQCISFEDQSNMASEMKEAIMGVSMAMGFMQMGAAQMPPQAQRLINAGAQMLSKLIPVVEKMNFFASTASFTTYDRNGWRTRAVQNYKSPEQVKRLSDPTAGSSAP